MKIVYVITCKSKDGKMVRREMFSEFQASTIINILSSEGCKDFKVKEVVR